MQSKAMALQGQGGSGTNPEAVALKVGVSAAANTAKEVPLKERKEEEPSEEDSSSEGCRATEAGIAKEDNRGGILCSSDIQVENKEVVNGDRDEEDNNHDDEGGSSVDSQDCGRLRGNTSRTHPLPMQLSTVKTGLTSISIMVMVCCQLLMREV